MTPEIRYLLGGYATGTLTPEERARLFAAALDDQSLFDALAEEQPLKELLDDPESRGYLLDELGALSNVQEHSLQPAAVFGGAGGAPSPAPASIHQMPPPPSPARFWLPLSAVMAALFVTGILWYVYQPEPRVEIAVAVPASAPVPPSERRSTQPQAPAPKSPPAPTRAQRQRPSETVVESKPEPSAAMADRAEKKVEELAAEKEVAVAAPASPRQAAPVVATQGGAAPVAPAAARLEAAGNLAAVARPYQLLRLANGEYTPAGAAARFAPGESIAIRFPAGPKPHLTLADGTPIAVEREGAGYRSVKIQLASGVQEFVVSPEEDRARSRLPSPQPSTAKAASTHESFRIRISVD